MDHLADRSRALGEERDQLVLEAIEEAGAWGIRAVEIAETTGLSLSAVKRAVVRLKGAGDVWQAGTKGRIYASAIDQVEAELRQLEEGAEETDYAGEPRPPGLALLDGIGRWWQRLTESSDYYSEADVDVEEEDDAEHELEEPMIEAAPPTAVPVERPVRATQRRSAPAAPANETAPPLPQLGHRFGLGKRSKV